MKNFSSSNTSQNVKPSEDNWFYVNPLEIDVSIFEKKKRDIHQDVTRQMIYEVLKKVAENPEEYGKPFKTMMPKKTWPSKTVAELKELAETLGDRIAQEYEQILEWAQRIANGESWKDLCNKKDTANWYRLVEYNKQGWCKQYGGSVLGLFNYPAVDRGDICWDDDVLNDTVPLVVSYEMG